MTHVPGFMQHQLVVPAPSKGKVVSWTEPQRAAGLPHELCVSPDEAASLEEWASFGVT